MEYIRKCYGVPAKRGGHVIYSGSRYGVIVGSKGKYLRIRLDGETRIKSYHPTYLLTYI
jgi:hypothetical protein